MSSGETRSAAEALSPEQEHFIAKEAFELAAIDFDELTKTEGAWHHLDNWQFNRHGRNYQSYVYDKVAKMRAAVKLVTTHQALAAAFAALPEKSQWNLTGWPEISFECPGGQSNGEAPASFEFNLPEIVAGFRAWRRINKQYDLQWRQAVKADQIEMDAVAYGRTNWQSKALFHDSIEQAANFLIAGNECFYDSTLDTPETQLALARLEQLEQLSKIYLEALFNGDEGTRLALHAWIRRVNGRFLRVCETTDVASRMFKIPIDLWVQNVYPHEGALIPIGQTMVRGKNVKRAEHNEYVAANY